MMIEGFWFGHSVMVEVSAILNLAMMKSKHNRRRTLRTILVITWALVLVGAFIIIAKQASSATTLPVAPLNAATGSSLQQSGSALDLQGTATVEQGTPGSKGLQGGDGTAGQSALELY